MSNSRSRKMIRLTPGENAMVRAMIAIAGLLLTANTANADKMYERSHSFCFSDAARQTLTPVPAGSPPGEKSLVCADSAARLLFSTMGDRNEFGQDNLAPGCASGCSGASWQRRWRNWSQPNMTQCFSYKNKVFFCEFWIQNVSGGVYAPSDDL